MKYYDEGKDYEAEMIAKEALQLLRRIPHIEKEFSQAWHLLQQALKTLWMAEGTGLASKRSQELLREASREARSAYNALKTYEYNISKAYAKNAINLVSLAYDVDRVYQKNPKTLKVDEDLLQETVTNFGFLIGTASTIIGMAVLLRRRKMVL